MAKNKNSENAIRFNAEHTKRVFLNLNTQYDKDILDKLAEEPNKAGLIKKLLRQHYFGGGNRE